MLVAAFQILKNINVGSDSCPVLDLIVLLIYVGYALSDIESHVSIFKYSATDHMSKKLNLGVLVIR